VDLSGSNVRRIIDPVQTLLKDWIEDRNWKRNISAAFLKHHRIQTPSWYPPAIWRTPLKGQQKEAQVLLTRSRSAEIWGGLELGKRVPKLVTHTSASWPLATPAHNPFSLRTLHLHPPRRAQDENLP
jgi:hypothetical protein